MAGSYEGGGDISKGGFFVHYRDGFGRCEWAFVTASHPGAALNLKVIQNDPDQMVWRPKTRHGAGKDEWHHPDQCQMTEAQIKADEEKVLAAR